MNSKTKAVLAAIVIIIAGIVFLLTSPHQRPKNGNRLLKIESTAQQPTTDASSNRLHSIAPSYEEDTETDESDFNFEENEAEINHVN